MHLPDFPRRGIIMAALYIVSIVASAWLIEQFGILPVGFGMSAPAGAYVIGLTLVFRDLTQDQLGPRNTFILMVAGTALSALVSPAVALASALAFLAAQTVDMLIYTPIRARGFLVTAILVSSAFSILVDSVVFVTVALGFSWEYTIGQSFAKAVSTILVAFLLKFIYRKRQDPRPYYLVKREAEQQAAAQPATV